MKPTDTTPYDAAVELSKRKDARKTLLNFTCYTKPDYEVNWHHRVLCDYLDRFVAGEIKRLMVFMPPRHGKSEICSRRLPAYFFGRYPNKSIISCSYSADLASRMNRDVQRIIDSKEYHAVFADTNLSGENVRSTAQGAYLRNSDIFEIVGKSGAYRSCGVGGGITGMGFHVGIIDDPIKNREEAISPTYRKKLWEWYTSTFYTRMEKDAQILFIMTRWHMDDLAGKILSRAQAGGEEWTIVDFPAIAEENHTADDPRRPGEALWPGKYPLEALENYRQVLGPYQFSALYQQHPVPVEGGMWKYETIEKYRVPAYPKPLARIVVAIDPAATSLQGSDETGIIVAGIDGNGHAYIIEDLSGRYQPIEWASKAVEAYRAYQADRIVAEVNQGGEMVETTLRTIDSTVPYKAVHASRGKAVRAEPVAALYEQGRVHHFNTLSKLEDQLCNWSQGERSPDRLDAMVWALTELILENSYGLGQPADPLGYKTPAQSSPITFMKQSQPMFSSSKRIPGMY